MTSATQAITALKSRPRRLPTPGKLATVFGNRPAQGGGLCLAVGLGIGMLEAWQGRPAALWQFHGAAVAGTVFILIGLVLLVFGIGWGIYRCYIVRHGDVAGGRLVKKWGVRLPARSDEGTSEPTNLVRDYYEYVGRNGETYTTSAWRSYTGRTRGFTVWTVERDEIADDETRLVFYLSARPGRAVVLETLPAEVSVTESGEIQANNPLAVSWKLIPVLLALVAMLGFLLILYWR
jgi:hypothetical protein